MGKRSKKIQRKNKMEKKEELKSMHAELSADFYHALTIAKNHKEEGKYNEGLETLIATFEQYGVQPVSAYETAEIYYASGDYERTAIWCENVLKLDNSYVDAYLLLTKLALLRDQTENALALLDKVCMLANHEISTYRDTMEELLQIILIDYDEATLQNQHPLLWQCMYGKELEEAKLENQQLSDDLPSAEEKNVLDDIEETIEEDEIPGNEDGYEAVQAEIMAMQLSLKEKLSLCQQNAAEYYLRGNLQGALAVLKLAMAIDATDELTLKNLGFILLALGQRVEALQCFAKIKQSDLMVLKAKAE